MTILAMIIAKIINIGNNTKIFSIAVARLKNEVNIMISFPFHILYITLSANKNKVYAHAYTLKKYY